MFILFNVVESSGNYFPHHSILFDQTKIVDTSLGLLQSFREIIEVKKIIYGGISINRDEGEFVMVYHFSFLIFTS
jgi:hypothetical protein